MKAVAEYWTTGVRRFASEYGMIVRNAFAFNGLGFPASRALVVGAIVPSNKDGEKVYQYTFLWIVDPKAEKSLGVSQRYVLELRQAMCHLFRLCKVEVVFRDIDLEDMEKSMLRSFNDFPNVVSVEEFFYAEDSSSKLDRKVHFPKELPAVSSGSEEEAAETPEQECSESEDETYVGSPDSGECERVKLAAFSPLKAASVKKARAGHTVSAMWFAEELIYDINMCSRCRLRVSTKVLRSVWLISWLR
jgi:hypothetical protein